MSENQHGGHDTFFLVLHHPRHEISHTSRFRTFRGENVMFLRDYDVITQGFPQNWGFPMILFQFRIGTCIPTPESELTIPVLFKTSFKYRFLPPCPPLLHPPYPTPLPHPSCPNPLAPFRNPFPQQCVPPAKSKSAIKNS